MARATGVIERLRDTHTLTAGQFKSLLENDDPQDMRFLQEAARKTALSVFGPCIFIRGLIEVSNYCRNNCYYCGIRAANTRIRRYRLSKVQILKCCLDGHALGFRTFVLQGGEDPMLTDGWVEDVVRSIRTAFPDCAITLSLGEKAPESYQKFRKAGADRYLLRHETFDPDHYGRLHPAGMCRDNRLECLAVLKKNGFQTGSGIMAGSPWQTLDHVVDDLLFLQELRPEMIGIGPFVHHHDTPFASFPDGSVTLTLKLISILRLMNPQALIPATTALATLEPDGHKKGILAGANVVMPNLSPASVRRDYALYDNKAALAAESAEGLEELQTELRSIGYDILVDRGDYAEKTFIKTNATADV